MYGSGIQILTKKSAHFRFVQEDNNINIIHKNFKKSNLHMEDVQSYNRIVMF